MDPHEEIWPRETGQWYDIDKHAYKVDTFAPFEGLCGFSTHVGSYNGTLFRFPLRNEQRDKRVSKHIYDVNNLRSLLTALREEAKCILLFLRSVRTVEVFEISRSGNHSNLLKMSICETSGDSLGPKRRRFQENLKMRFEAQSFGIRNTLSQIVHVQVDVSDYQQGTDGSSKWLVANQVGSQSAEVRKLANTLKVFPWVGVALETSADELEKSGGRVFCVLPMPQDVSCYLPVHVNGTFSLNDERRQLKWCGVERKNDPSAQWNHRLVEELLPPCYVSLLLDHAQILLKPDQFCRAWPNTWRVKGTHWEGLLNPVLTALFAHRVIPFCKPGGLGAVAWVKVSSATFVPRGSTLPGVVSTALIACGVKLVTVSEEVWNALNHCRIPVRSVTPSLTRNELKKSNRSYNGFSSAQKLELLQYCLSDNAYGDMHNLELLPLVNGNFGTFGTPSSAPVYLCTQQCPHYLLPRLEGELVDEKIETQLYKKLKTIAQGRNTNLQILTVNNVATLLPRAMPQEWQHQNTVTLSYSNSNFNMEWLKRFWQWVTGGNLYLFADQLLVPVSDTTVTRFSKSSPTIFIPSTANCSQYLVSALKKLQVQCCEQKRHQFVQHNSYISQHVNYFSPDGIIDVISCASSYHGNVSFTPQEARELIMHVHRVTLNPQRQTTLRNIPMFATMKNTNESLYSVKQVEYSTGRMAQMEPPSFPLNPKNIPSIVVLFSHSNNYQRILLQGLSVQHTTTVDLLMYNLFPLIETGSMGRNAAKSLMREVLEKFNDITSRTASQKKVDFQNAIARLSFVPVSVGKPKAPNTLYSPDIELKNLFYQEPVFPLEPFSTGLCLNVLKRCGLKTTVSTQEIVDIIESISSPANTFPVPVDEVKHKRARAILSYVRNWGHQLSESVCIPGQSNYYLQRNLNFSAVLKELSKTRSWLPVQCSPPTDYPPCLTWKGSGYTCHLVSYGTSVLLSRDQSSLAVACGSQMYFVEHSLQQALCKEFTPEPEKMVRHIMAHLEQVILNHRQFSRVEEVRKITQVIYQLLSKYHTKGASVDLSLLEATEDCVWLPKQKKFVHPTIIALEQNSTFRQNLEPFIYILPDDLDEHESLFKALGVQQAVTRPQILGILEKIRDGDSQNLGVSNHQAWNMVMIILNWLTGNGEHDVDDVDFLLVPVEPDTDWPTLVSVDDDVVYTDSEFLQRFLEGSSEGKIKYKFVNHRISSKLAHQLRLTPLSKYLNISEDAFEDVGPGEPLTVRLKNILKDYKDGLTIIKELLQNADDAEASEMNICYDARYHTDKRRSLFFPGMAQCHGPALVVNNDAMFSKEDFQNITKLAGATKEGKVLKIGKFGVGFCSVYHITDIPSFVSNDLLYIFDPTLTYLKDEIKNPARPGKKVQFTSRFISESNQLAPYIGLFGFYPRSQYKGTTFRFPFRKAASELSGKIYGEDDVKTLMEKVQISSSKLLLFLRHVKLVTVSQIDSGQASPREIMRITKAKETITGNRCVYQITCSVNGSPDTTEFWMIETCTETILEKYSTASVACALSPLSDRGIYKLKQVEGEVFCFLPLSVKTGLPVHVSGNFAVSNNRTGIWTSDDKSKESSNEVQWNESLMKGVICSAYCELLEGLKELQSDSKLSEYDFFSMWPLERELRVVNPWCHCVEAVYEDIVGRELFFSLSTDKWLTLDESTFLHPDILKVRQSPSFPRPVLDVVNHLELPVVHLPPKYHDHLDITGYTETEEAFLEHFFSNIDELQVIKESRNGVLRLTLECYAHELDQNDEDRFDYLEGFLHENDCIPCEPNGELLKQTNELIHPCAYFAKLYDVDENLFPLKIFCSKKLVTQAMKDLGILYDSIPLQNLEERATGIATIYDNDQLKAMERAKLITECLMNEDKYKGFSTEDCAELAGIAFLPVISKPTDYPLPWKGEDDRLYAGAEIVLKGVHVFQIKEDYTNMNIAGSQVVFLNQDLPCDGGCGRLALRVREMLQIRESPNYSEVISHYQLLIETFDSDSPKMIKWADRISRKVYEFLDKLLKSVNFQESEEMQGTFSALAERACIWTGESFVEISVVAKNWKLKGPYLHSVPESMVTRKSLQNILGIREHFTTEDYIHALQYLKGDYGVNPLPHNCQILVRAILPELPTTESDNDYGSVMLPDSEFVMQEATKLYYNDMPWQPPDEEYVFVHERVPLATAKVLGVQLCRTASLARYLLPGSGFTVVEFGQHEELTRRIQNIIRDYPFDMTILKELLQNADDAKATKMHVILDMREHSKEHVLSEKWSDDLQGPALLVWNDSVFSEEDLKGIQKLGLGSKRSDSETIGQYGIGFNAVYHLTDCPSFLTGGNTLCILDPHMRYVPQATDRHPGAMYQNLDDSFWKSFDGLKSLYLRDSVPNAPKELLGGSLFRFPLRHTLSLVRSSDIVKDIDNKTLDRVLSGQKMCTLLAEWAPHMKQSLLFLNNVTELKFFVITDRRGVLKLQNSYRTELTENAVQHRSELTKMIKSFNDADSRKPFITTYPLTIVESDMNRGKDRHEEWLIQQGTGDIENNVNTWSYVEQVKPRHGIAAPMRHDKVSWVGQVFCFLPLPLFSKLPVHINGHFILNSTRRNLWVATDLERGDDKSHWNENLLKAIASSYAHFLERIPEYFTDLEGCCSREAFENATEHYYINFPRKNKEPISEPWLQLINDVFKIMKRRNSPVLAVPTNKSSRSSEDKYLLQWQTLRSEKMPASQAYFWEKMGGGKKQVSKMRSIFERIGMKITCAPMWVMRHFKGVECEIPVISRVSVYKFYIDYNQRFISNCFPRDIHDTPFKSVEDFKVLTEFLLETTTELKKQAVFPQQPFGYPLLLTADNQLRVFDQANKVLCSKHANMFPKCPQSFLHKDLIGCSYSMSYFVSELDHKAVRVNIVKELLETVLPRELKNMYVSAECEAVEKVDIKGLWNCFKDDEVFKSVLDEVLKVWALLLTRDSRLFRCTSSEQLLPIIPGMTTSLADVSYVVEKELQGPFLDTTVVPVEIVKTFCPTLSDHKAILRNLFYLHREQPFTEKVSVHSAGILVSYFANIHFKNEPNCCYTLKYLPLFETIDGKLTILEGKRVYVWPANICQEGNDKWLKGTNLIFLKGWAAWKKLGIDSELGIKRITAEETYIQFIFPNFFKMSKQERYLHLKYIRDYLFNTNLVIQHNSWPASQFVAGLKNLHCIGEDGSTLQPISSFCTHKKTIFRTFPEHFPTLPEDFLQRDERMWMTFFQKLGLQETVTARVFVCLCNDVANGKLGENTETASKVLLDYLFSIEENKHHGYHNDAQLLAQISNIAFVCPTPMPELEWIHKAPQTPNRVIVSSTKDIPLCKLSGSCSKKHKDILWMVKSIVSVSESNEKLLQQLQLCIQPSVRDVIMGIKALSKTHFADSTLFTKYTAPHCKPGQTELTTVMIRIFEYLHSTTGDVSELKALPCIPVFALSVKDSGQYPVLVKPHCVVCRPTKETKPYYPFLHSADKLYRIKELLEKVGVEDSVKLRHMQIVLESVFEETGDMELDPNTKNVVSSAVHQIKCLLTSNKEDRRSQMGERALAEQLEPLYLSGTDKRMHHINSLVYCPGMKRDNIDLTGTDLFLLWTPMKYDVHPEKFCELLPKAVRPRPLSQLCIKKVSSSCKVCEMTPPVIEIQKTLQFPQLPHVMSMSVKSFTSSATPSESVQDVFEEHATNIFDSLEIRCTERLKIDIFLKNSDNSRAIASEYVRSFLQKEENSYYLHIDSKIRPLLLSEVHECIVNELVSCLRTILQESDINKISKFLKTLLTITNPEEMLHHLQDHEISYHGFDFVECSEEPTLGAPLPKLWHFRLDMSSENIFQSQEWVAYRPDIDKDMECVFAQISHPVNLKDPSGQPLKPMQMEYVIFVSEDDTEGLKVKAIDLFKFIRGKKAPVDSAPVESESLEIVPFEGDPEKTSPPPAPINVQQAKEEVRKELEEIWRLPKDDHRKAIHRLYLKWHPDKNPDYPELAEEVFKFLKEELDRHERGVGVSGSASPTPHRSWRTYQRSWDYTARQHRQYREWDEQSSSSSETAGAEGSTGSSRQRQRRRGQSGGGSTFFNCNFTPPKNDQEARRWVRQAVVDCKILKAVFDKAQTDVELSCHVCFMAHEVAEKALKGAMYATCGLRENSRRNHNIIPLAKSIELARPIHAGGLSTLAAPLEPTYYEDTRFPKESSPSSVPFENFSLDDAVSAAECAEAILKIARDIVNVDI